MGKLSKICRGRPAVQGEDPPVLQSNKATARARELHNSISSLVRPSVVPREGGTAIVNLQCDRHADNAVRTFKRLSSMPASRDVASSARELHWTASRHNLEAKLREEQQATSNGSDEASDMLSQEQRLQARLDRLNLDVLIARGDGNCQFRSVSQQLYGSQEHHAGVRAAAVAHMRQHREDFEAFLGEDFGSYTTGMAHDGTWGDELTLRATSDAYGVIINVVTSDQANWFLKYEPRRCLLQHELFLTYIKPIHYNSLKRRASLRDLTEALSETLSRTFSGNAVKPALPTDRILSAPVRHAVSSGGSS